MGEGARSGLHFGLTSGVITTLGLTVGLHAGTDSLQAVVGGILTIAVADAMADALGMHISKEADHLPVRQVWNATFATFATKFLMAISFLLPLLLLPLTVAVVVSVVWGILVVAVLSLRLARARQEAVLPVVGEHVAIAIVVVVATHYLGELVAHLFGS